MRYDVININYSILKIVGLQIMHEGAAMIVEDQRQATLDSIDGLLRMLIWHAQKQASHTLSRPEIGLTLPQMMTLYAIHGAQTCRMSDLADVTQQSAGTLTGIVDRLIDDGLVERVRDVTDRRVVHVALTPAGTARLSAVETARRDDMAHTLEAFDDDELRALARLLHRFLEGVQRSNS
jgi:DNA-binding MarR family transcriptional regulator